MQGVLTDNSLIVLKKRYLAKDPEGNIVETPDEMWLRVARNIGEAEACYGGDVERTVARFYDVLSALEFIPNSPTLMNAGRSLQMLSGCFVIPVGDSMEEIFDGVKSMALVQKAGGGTGFSFSNLRPEGDKVGSTGGIASGPISFMQVYNTATEAVKQGSTRRGANMGILRVDHPDVRKFIELKSMEGSMINFNISVAVTDEFMTALANGASYPLINPRSGAITGWEKASDIFDLIATMAWHTGDPGVVFIDQINLDHPNPHLGTIESTNPCGEQPLLPYESCNLGSINLAKMTWQNSEGTHFIHWSKIAEICATAVRFLDNVITVNRFPLVEITEMTELTRRIGLGVMGWADMLILLGIRYDSEAALDLAMAVAEFIRRSVDDASSQLARQRGCYPAWEGSTYASEGRLMRNTAPITIAPTGTISIIAGASSGIEPLYALSYERRQAETVMFDYNAMFVAALKNEGWSDNGIDRTMFRLDHGGELGKGDLQYIPEHIVSLFRTTHVIEASWHVRMQAAWQKFVSNAVSKTINFPYNATVEDIRAAYLLAYEIGCKGITVYRDGSKALQVLSTGHNGSGVCPDCQNVLIYQEGCFLCPVCGWGKCSL